MFDPDKRITVNEALEHPYLADLHFEDDEPTTEPVSAFDFDFELYDLEQEDYKQLVYEEVLLYHDGDFLHSRLHYRSRSSRCWQPC